MPFHQAAIPGLGLPPEQLPFVDYSEGADIGYRWYAARGTKPLFPFGFGLSYSSFRMDALTVTGGTMPKASFRACSGDISPALALSS